MKTDFRPFPRGNHIRNRFSVVIRESRKEHQEILTRGKIFPQKKLKR
jgi:hypothetical protein